MDWIDYADVSSCVLFEATADSEADSDINRNMDHALLREDMGLAEDDALSCSCDDSDFKGFYPSTADPEFDLDDEQEELADDYKNVDEDNDDDEEEDAVDQLRNGDSKVKDLKAAVASASRGVVMELEGRQRKKLKVCADSVKEFMNERDNDRLFWETCLAS